MIRPTVEYVGFQNTGDRREYRLRLRRGDDIREYTVGIELGAFTSGHVRYQDGPEIAFMKLNRELLVTGEAPADADFTVTEAELTEYRDAHKSKDRLAPSAASAAATAAAAAARPVATP